MYHKVAIGGHSVVIAPVVNSTAKIFRSLHVSPGGLNGLALTSRTVLEPESQFRGNLKSTIQELTGPINQS